MAVFNENTTKLLQELKKQIMEEYDASQEIAVRVNLMPLSHNSMSKYTKNPDGSLRKIHDYNEPENPLNVIIHETTTGKTPFMNEGMDTENVERPTKPPKTLNWNRYDNLIKKGSLQEPSDYGDTIGYHARIDYPGMMGRPEIVILEPAVSSPDQAGNVNVTPYVYGIERCVGEDQNYHLSIANQAMLTAFVLKEIGYDKEQAMKHIFPHNFFAKNNKACPARMLYASTLLRKSQKEALTDQDVEDIKEYVPWEVFTELVGEFIERDKYPQALEEKFIFDMDDYQAYTNNPQEYNYTQRRGLKHRAKYNEIELMPKKLDITGLQTQISNKIHEEDMER